MSALMWWLLGGLVVVGGVLTIVLSALRHWIAAALFFVVWVIGVVATAVQAVMTS